MCLCASYLFLWLHSAFSAYLQFLSHSGKVNRTNTQSHFPLLCASAATAAIRARLESCATLSSVLRYLRVGRWMGGRCSACCLDTTALVHTNNNNSNMKMCIIQDARTHPNNAEYSNSKPVEKEICILYIRCMCYTSTYWQNEFKQRNFCEKPSNICLF